MTRAQQIVSALLDHCGTCAADLKKRHAVGVEVEKEHTSDPKKASEIANTHEKENELYYPIDPKPKGAKEVLRWVKEAYGDDAWHFANGKKWGLKDKLTDTERDLEHYPPAFVKGYRLVRREGWWQKTNDRITDWLGRLGSSNIRR